MKFRLFLFVILFACALNSFAQMQSRIEGFGDGEVAAQYVEWAQKAISEGRWNEALIALERAKDFANVSSDISYLLAMTRDFNGKSKTGVIEALDSAIETNRWISRDYMIDAPVYKASVLCQLRKYNEALAALEQAGIGLSLNEYKAHVHLLIFKGMAASGDASALALFRSNLVKYMDRYPQDSVLLDIFFEYARNRIPESPYDTDILEFVLRRLPFIIEAAPELAWKAAPFMRDTEEARRYTAAYRAGSLSNIQGGNFLPHPGSIPAALNLGLLGDTEAVDELFLEIRGLNNQLQAGIPADGRPVLDRRILTDVFDLLRSDEGRDYFTLKLLSFSGLIVSDDDNDKVIDSYAVYENGVVREFYLDKDQNNVFDFKIAFSADGVPVLADIPVMGQKEPALVTWDQSMSTSRYPLVKSVKLDDEDFSFPHASFSYAPVELSLLGGSKNAAGAVYPVVIPQNIILTRRTLVSFASSLIRKSTEFPGAMEVISLERGVPVKAVEQKDGDEISVTEFSLGAPVIQYVDVDMDGRKETIRRFHRPAPGSAFFQTFNYRSLVASSESDWTGDGKYMTKEVYPQDGSVVYSWDMDGSGTQNHSETRPGTE
jgi:tetratricopeptide (TPR) repeat protein